MFNGSFKILKGEYSELHGPTTITRLLEHIRRKIGQFGKLSQNMKGNFPLFNLDELLFTKFKDEIS